jgi:hypothetical protein
MPDNALLSAMPDTDADTQAPSTPEPAQTPTPISPAPGTTSPTVKVNMSKFVPLSSLAAASKPSAEPTAQPAVDMSKFTPLSATSSAGTEDHPKIDWTGLGTEPIGEQIKQSVLDNPISEAIVHTLAKPSEWAEQRRQANLAAVANGKPKPYSDNVTAFLDGAGSLGRIVGGLTQPKNLALIPAAGVAPEAVSAYVIHQGLKSAIEPKRPDETEAQYEERRFMGLAMVAGGFTGAAEGANAPDAVVNAAQAGTHIIGHSLAHPLDTINNLTGQRVFEYSPREVEGTEVTGRRSAANLAQGPINRSMGATPRDVRYGDPAKALIDNNIMAPTNIGRLQAVNQALADISPKVDAALAANPKTVDVDSIIEDRITQAQQEVQKSKMTPAEKRTANRQLEALREEEPKEGGYNLKDANDVKQRIGDVVNWEKRPAPMATPVESAYRATYGDIKSAINKASPDVAAMNENRTNLIAAQHSIQEGALLKSKVGQGPMAHSMGVFNPQLYEAIAGHALSPILAAFGHTPEIPEVGAAAGTPESLVPAPENSPVPEETPQGGHAGGGVVSLEELNRPGHFVKISRSGMPTYFGKSPDVGELKPGEAFYQVKPDGSFELRAGQETPLTKEAVQRYIKDVYK